MAWRSPHRRRRAERRADRLTPDEAERIRQQRAAGRLDDEDDSIRRVIDDANRSAVRAHVWGATPEARRTGMAVVLVVAGGVLLFIGGLIAELFLSQP